VRLGPAQVHAQDHIGPVLGFGATGARLDVEVGIVGIQLAGEHAPEFEFGDAFLESPQIALDLGHRLGVVFLDREVEQFTGIVEPGDQLVEARYDLLERRPLLAQRLGALGFVPDIRLLEFALDFGQALCLAFVVKDTSSTHRSVR
jgi:hypothetical protein